MELTKATFDALPPSVRESAIRLIPLMGKVCTAPSILFPTVGEMTFAIPLPEFRCLDLTSLGGTHNLQVRCMFRMAREVWSFGYLSASRDWREVTDAVHQPPLA